MPVATPHEVLLAFRPDKFLWESKIQTDFRVLLRVLDEAKDEATNVPDKVQQPDQDTLALVKAEHRDLVPIFSAPVLSKFENQSFKGLDIQTQKALQKDKDGNTVIKPIQKGLSGIASRYDH